MLKFYFIEMCPYCRKVRLLLETLGVTYTVIPAGKNTAGRAELLRIGGKVQVPFMVDDSQNISMYESEDIMKHIKQNYG